MKLLMCPPDYFSVVYEINPFMHQEITVDHERAKQQWEDLRVTLERGGAEVVIQDPQPNHPDLVFTANAGLVVDGIAVPARFLHPERKGEEEHDREWFASHGFEVRELPGDAAFEGAGDAFPAGPAGAILAGYRWRSSIESHRLLADALHRPVRSLTVTEPRLYHLDLALLPVGQDKALAVGAGFDRHGATLIRTTVPEVEELTLEEGLEFCANAVVVGEAVVMHRCPPRVGRILERWGYSPVESPVSEFLKAGGSCRCLTLRLT
jgi:N-dimethylarginine dimethylaminohydrolase